MGAVKPFQGGPLGVPEMQDGGVWEADHSPSLAPSKTKACKPPSHHPSPAYSPNQESYMPSGFPDL